MSLSLGVIGFGAIGRSVCDAVRSGAAGDATVAAILVRDAAKYRAAAPEFAGLLWDEPDGFFAQRMDLVVESAGHEALRKYAVRSLSSGRDYLTVSVGALADDAVLSAVVEAARSSGRRVVVPSGAIAGLDAIAAAAVGGLDEVSITSRKPPQAWKGTAAEKMVDLDSVVEPMCVYEGAARDAAKLFPQNVNVQAALALAGIGMERTRSRVFADPTVQYNTHEIVARGSFGELRVSVSNIPSESNPKTGRITAMSVVKAIRNLTAPLVVGA